MDNFTYKNYIGSIDYYMDEWYGKILNIDDLVTYSGFNKEDLYKEFILVVEDYEATCKELDREPRFKDHQC